MLLTGNLYSFVCVTILCLPATAALAQPVKPPPSQHDHLDHRFEDAEKYAKRFDDPSRDAWQMPDRVIKELGLKAGQTVADIGAGTGYFSMRLAQSNAGIQVFGADVELTMVEHMRARALKEGVKNFAAVQASAGTPNLPTSVDLVLIVDTYHHIGDRANYFRKLAAASLKPGGRVAIIDFKPESKMGPPAEFKFTAAQIRAEMEQAGFERVSGPAFLPEQLFEIFSLKP